MRAHLPCVSQDLSLINELLPASVQLRLSHAPNTALKFGLLKALTGKTTDTRGFNEDERRVNVAVDLVLEGLWLGLGGFSI